MENLREPLCSWDSAIVERYNDYTTGNTEEVLPGVTRPLPADLIRAWEQRWHRIAVRELDIEDLVPIPDPPGATMLPIVAGQFVVNIGIVNAFTSTFETGGSADYLKQFFEGDDEITAEVASDAERAAATRARLAAFWPRAEEIVAADAARVRAAADACRARDWAAASDADLLEAVASTTALCGDVFFTHYWVTSSAGMQATLLGGLLDEHAPDHPPEWAGGLASGLTGVESARPAKAIWDLSRFAAARPALAAELADVDAAALAERLDAPPDADWAAFAREWSAFMADLGFRGQRETDPSCATWDEAPQFVLGALRADLAAGAERDPHALEAARAAEREALEAVVEAALPADARPEFRSILALTQTLSREREGTKANWTRSTRTYRPPLRELGRRLAERGLLLDPDDVWFLRLAELPDAVADELSPAETQDAVAERRREYERLHDYELPVLFSRPVEASPRRRAAASGETVFRATGVSPGKARGRARVVLSAEAGAGATVLPGEILVAPVTDAPWTPLFIPATGVVVETGGALSHAATVAREYGIPAVAGVRDATTLIPDGAMLAIDGATGEVVVEG